MYEPYLVALFEIFERGLQADTERDSIWIARKEVQFQIMLVDD
jgi:hypothetical protein